MTMPFAAPDWMPGWLLLALAVPILLWLLAFLMVPFNVFGVKARLETIENELAELNEQIRVMQLRAAGRLPADVAARPAETYDDLPSFAQLKRSRTEHHPVQEEPAPLTKRPPIPTQQPRSGFSNREPLSARERQPAPPRHRRTEPKLD